MYLKFIKMWLNKSFYSIISKNIHNLHFRKALFTIMRYLWIQYEFLMIDYTVALFANCLFHSDPAWYSPSAGLTGGRAGHVRHFCSPAA